MYGLCKEVCIRRHKDRTNVLVRNQLLVLPSNAAMVIEIREQEPETLNTPAALLFTF